MYYLLIVIHIIISLGLVLIILSQSSKGGGLSGMMGGAGNMLGGKGATDFMKKWTKILATLFFISSVGMAITVKRIQNSGPTKSKALQELQKERANKPAETQAEPAAETPTETQAQPQAEESDKEE